MNFSIIGYGTVGRPFTLGLIKSGAVCDAVYLKSDDPCRAQADIDGHSVLSINKFILESDLFVLAVPDTAIEPVAKELTTLVDRETLPSSLPVMMHFAGRFGLEPLSVLRELGFPCIAWHPVQTFIPGIGPERFQGIYAGITADKSALSTGFDISKRLGVIPLEVSGENRSAYHHACVLVSNFLPLLLEMAASRFEGITESREEACKALYPLLRGMVENLENNLPEDSMSGPVARNDLEAVLSHLEGWNDQESKEVYKMLTLELVKLAKRYGKLSPGDSELWSKSINKP